MYTEKDPVPVILPEVVPEIVLPEDSLREVEHAFSVVAPVESAITTEIVK